MIKTMDIIKSWAECEGDSSTTEDIIEWVRQLNNETYVRIDECSINDSDFWFYDDYTGEILNRKRSFFSIVGMRRFVDGGFAGEQPLIIQPEIGYLGIVCRKIDGILHFLMQAKIEPGNVNCVQISPTIQATKSNFTRAHGGKLPTYFDLFESSGRHGVIYDQIQSEQGARFYGKRNRNIIMACDDDLVVYPNYRWMTLGQIKKLMEFDNIVNMDTRTVLSGMPLITHSLSEKERLKARGLFNDDSLYSSIFECNPMDSLPKVFGMLNDYKMFRDVRMTKVPLYQLLDWEINEYGITCRRSADFMVRYYDIEIFGREVQHWTQPLFKATGMGTFALMTRIEKEVRQFLVRVKPEIGSFDKVEIGPSVQWEPSHTPEDDDSIGAFFREHCQDGAGTLVDVVLSEEGGRFYHEQNRNVILEVGADDLVDMPGDYIWVDYATLGYLGQMNNCLNIQLRNLLSLMNI